MQYYKFLHNLAIIFLFFSIIMARWHIVNQAVSLFKWIKYKKKIVSFLLDFQAGAEECLDFSKRAFWVTRMIFFKAFSFKEKKELSLLSPPKKV